MKPPANKKYVSDVDEQLDALFEWEQSSNNSSNNGSVNDDPLKNLKITLWSIDWEITDRLMLKLNEELNLLKARFREDHTSFMFLQLLGAVGKYIKKRKGRSHPESIDLLRNLFTELESSLKAGGMSEKEKKTVLRKQIAQFNDLKQKLAVVRAAEEAEKAAAAKPEKTEAVSSATPVAGKTVAELFELMKADIQKLIRDEIEAYQKESRKRQIYK